jgi:dTDP-4-amino-4,6-dideoxygalactose transaminase
VTAPGILSGVPALPKRLPLVRPTIDDPAALTAALGEVLASGMLTNAARVRELEEAVEERLGVRHVVAVSSCTAGLMLTYQALGVGPGSRVVLPSFTFAASAHAVSWTGADPDFVEVTPERVSLDVDDLKGRLDGDVHLAAISATHVYGHPAEVEAIEAIAAERGVPVVYDAAHALGSERAGRPIGGFGRAEVFSLSPTKVVVAGEGGLVATDDSELAARLRLGRDYGNPGDYNCRFPGLNARMSELHAVVALASLAGLDQHIDARVALVDRFAASVEGLAGLRVVRPAAGDRSTFKDLTIAIDAATFGLSAAELQQALAADGIDSRRYYAPPIHRQDAHASAWADRRPLPVTDALAADVLSPPLWSHMSAEQIDSVTEALLRIHEHAPRVAAALREASRLSSLRAVDGHS